MPYDFPSSPTVGQIFQGWTWDGEKWLQTLAVPNAGGVVGIQVFTQNGTYTPSASMTTCLIECVGGGAAGSGVTGALNNFQVSGGGGAGGYSRKFATAANVGSSVAVTIGAGGIGTSGQGPAGSDTSFGALCVAKGAPAVASAAAGGLGGPVAGAVGDLVIPGQPGQGGAYNNVSANVIMSSAGNGGSSPFGAGGLGKMWAAGVQSGFPGLGYGSGGAAACYSNATGTGLGGNGAPGLVVITEYGITTLGSAATTAGAVRFDVAQGLTVNQMAQARSNIGTTKRNYLINGAFQINQGGYASGAVLAAAAYGHDQWKAGASGGDYSFTQSTGATTITIASGKSLIQPIEDIRVTGGGSYVLAWTGTAQARAGVNTLTPSGTYAASPLLISGQTDGTVMSVEFNSGTLGSVGLYEGNVAPPFVVPDYPGELALCKRYFHKVPVVVETPTLYQSWAFPVEMRTNPTITGGGAGFVNQIPSISSCIASQTTRAVATLTFNARL